ncbi:ABC transporter F family member 4 isoform X2 [Ricinus communis]|uniref:ABC transporter F family member 4 isoform X2 n=1 Tax=Ricinus communis TaxID=3988 RepID=UPI000D69EA95|nr:ABC transporter F family member 4 isoform X2 [Ricinus communis]|eukprot:XP_025013609.1 ABC transporter F family member 4 isoform X1 [Ricinus communis]
MVSDSDLVTRLREILQDSDLNTATAGSVRRKLEEVFGVDLSDRKAFIREQIDSYLETLENDNKEDEEEDKPENEMHNEEENENENDAAEENEKQEENDENEQSEESERSKKAKKRGGGFTMLCSLSPQLHKFVGVSELARTEVVKKLWAYIRENDLQDPKNRRIIKCDEALRDLFRVNSINMFQMNKALSKHIWPLTAQAENEKLKAKDEDGDDSVSDSEASNDPGKEEEDEEGSVSEGSNDPSKEEEDEEEKMEEDEEEEEDNKRSKKGRATKVNKDVKKRGGGFTKLCSLSPQLQEFIGESKSARTEVVKKLWVYIRENNLQDPKNRRIILCDESLRALFRVDSINMFQMNKVLSKHIWPLNEEEENEKLKAKDEEGNDSVSEASNGSGKEGEDEEEKSEEDEEEEEGDKEEEEAVEKEDSERSKKGGATKVDKDVKKRGGGFTKLCSLSPQLQEFTGESELARTEVVKKLWIYIRENNLQDPKNKRNILCDESLRTLFRVDCINMFQMNKVLSKHIWPLDEEDAENSLQKERRSKQQREEDSDEPKQKEKRQKKGVSGLLVPLPLSDPLVKFIGTGENELSRADVVKRIWGYIKQNDLQDPSDKRRILCDDKLKELFEVDSFNGFSVSKLLTAHFIKMEQGAVQGCYPPRQELQYMGHLGGLQGL